MTNRKTAFSVLLILMLQAIVPILSANADTEGRTTPDFNVSILTLSDGGSVDNGGEYVVAITSFE